MLVKHRHVNIHFAFYTQYLLTIVSGILMTSVSSKSVQSFLHERVTNIHTSVQTFTFLIVGGKIVFVIKEITKTILPFTNSFNIFI